ncbi:hypothetical protein AXI76_gp050 [Pseudoalteromonas phage H101]|uniref:Uncharacterized protein n=1 Tax=Pseudoalteromonas phage H101 TaxID=1654919 RepID=A0A0H4ISW4_9CAUD|nr:hypothetical protein AXI76_gp050 [Pseudoalteromonas phage H101]AKO60951.1 hypothetical protein [Pseudoalteromonas phage H101]
MYYIKSKETYLYFSDYVCGSFVWKSHPARAAYSSDWMYLQGVIDTLEKVLDVCLKYELEIVWEEH